MDLRSFAEDRPFPDPHQSYTVPQDSSTTVSGPSSIEGSTLPAFESKLQGSTQPSPPKKQRFSLDLSALKRVASENDPPQPSTPPNKSPAQTWRELGSSVLRKTLDPLATLRRLQKQDLVNEQIEARLTIIRQTFVCLTGLMKDDTHVAINHLETLGFAVEEVEMIEGNHQYIKVKGGKGERDRLLRRNVMAVFDRFGRTKCLVKISVPGKCEDVKMKLSAAPILTEPASSTPTEKGHPIKDLILSLLTLEIWRKVLLPHYDFYDQL